MWSPVGVHDRFISTVFITQINVNRLLIQCNFKKYSLGEHYTLLQPLVSEMNYGRTAQREFEIVSLVFSVAMTVSIRSWQTHRRPVSQFESNQGFGPLIKIVFEYRIGLAIQIKK